MHFRISHKKGFTLIELLVVIAIIAILSVVVILTLNPAELLRQSRDSGRVADMGTLTTALGIFSEDQSSGFLGSSSVVYVSIPDPTATSTVGDQCQGLGLPTLPSTYSYHCAASSTYRNVNGQGWIPVSFSSISVGSPLGSLPIDPLNTSSTRNYYTYSTNGTQYEVTSVMESQKYKLGGSNDVIGPDGSTLSTVYAKGSNLALEPLDYGDTSLVGLWSFNEGTGSSTYDYSGNGNTGTWGGTATGTNGYYSPGKIGAWAGAFDGSSTIITINNPYPTYSALTMMYWVKFTSSTGSYQFPFDSNPDATWRLGINSVGNLYFDPGNHSDVTSALVSFQNWHLLSLTAYTVGSSANWVMYVDGNIVGNGSIAQSIRAVSGLYIGGVVPYGYWTNGLIDDVRIYNRALSASEIAAMYAGGK